MSNYSFESTEILMSVESTWFLYLVEPRALAVKTSVAISPHWLDCVYCDLIEKHILALTTQLNVLQKEVLHSFCKSAGWLNQNPGWSQETPSSIYWQAGGLLLLSSQQHALWQHTLQSQSEKTNPQRLAKPTLMKETTKNVISPISRLIKLCNRREFEEIIWRVAIMCFFPLPSFPQCFSQWKLLWIKVFFTTALAELKWKQIIF